MQAIYLEKARQIVKRQIEKPKIEDGEVLVKIRSVGVCGSDVHYYDKGRLRDFVVKKPLILGHECSGEVVEVGKNVDNLQIGDRVALEPGVPCRVCEYCKGGRYNLCPNMRFMSTPPIDGALVEYVAHPADFTFKIPEGVSFDEAALFEPLAVGLFAVKRANIKPGDRVLILGAGPIGLITLESVLCTKGTHVTVVELYEFRLAMAKKLGADEVISGKNGDILKKLEPEFNVVFETAGSAVTIQQTVKLAKKGGKVVLVGSTQLEEIPFDTNQVMSRQLDVLGVFRYANMYPRAVRLVENRGIDLKRLITHRFSFDETEKALGFARDKKDSCLKVIVRI